MLGDGDNVWRVDVLDIKVLLSSSIVNIGKLILRVYLPVSWSRLCIWQSWNLFIVGGIFTEFPPASDRVYVHDCRIISPGLGLLLNRYPISSKLIPG